MASKFKPYAEGNEETCTMTHEIIVTLHIAAR